MLHEIEIEVIIFTGRVVDGKRENEEYAHVILPFYGSEDEVKNAAIGLYKGYEYKANQIYGKGGWTTTAVNDEILLDGAF